MITMVADTPGRRAVKNPVFNAGTTMRDPEFIASYQILASKESDVAQTNVTIRLQRSGIRQERCAIGEI